MLRQKNCEFPGIGHFVILKLTLLFSKFLNIGIMSLHQKNYGIHAMANSVMALFPGFWKKMGLFSQPCNTTSDNVWKAL